MFKNKSNSGTNNLCGERISELRKQHRPKLSQRGLADKLQLFGIDVDKNAIQRIESGQRLITDIALKAIAGIFNVTCDELLKFTFCALTAISSARVKMPCSSCRDRHPHTGQALHYYLSFSDFPPYQLNLRAKPHHHKDRETPTQA